MWARLSTAPWAQGSMDSSLLEKTGSPAWQPRGDVNANSGNVKILMRLWPVASPVWAGP